MRGLVGGSVPRTASVAPRRASRRSRGQCARACVPTCLETTPLTVSRRACHACSRSCHCLFLAGVLDGRALLPGLQASFHVRPSVRPSGGGGIRHDTLRAGTSILHPRIGNSSLAIQAAASSARFLACLLPSLPFFLLILVLSRGQEPHQQQTKQSGWSELALASERGKERRREGWNGQSQSASQHAGKTYCIAPANVASVPQRPVPSRRLHLSLSLCCSAAARCCCCRMPNLIPCLLVPASAPASSLSLSLLASSLSLCSPSKQASNQGEPCRPCVLCSAHL